MPTSTKRKQGAVQAVGAAAAEPSSKKSKTTTTTGGSAPSFAGSWDKLKPILTPWILETIHTTFGFTNLTPVQASLIPLAISKNKDFLVEAVTGSGKTLSYVVPILERLVAKEAEMARERGSAGQGGTGVKGLRRNEVFALVVVPTRELAVQVHAVFELFFQGLRTYVADQKAMNNTPATKGTTDDDGTTETEQQQAAATPETIIVEEIYPSPLLLVSGQTTTSKSTTALPAPSPIIIGTPGRVASYLSTSLSTSSSSSTSAFARARKHLSLTPFSLLILDEADSLLSSPDHLRNMLTIWQTVPRQRRNWLFSATMMDVLSERTNGLLGQTGLERAGLKNLTRVVVKVETKVKGREQDQNGNDAAATTAAAVPAEVKQRRTPVSLQNTYILCHAAEKTLQLVRAMGTETTGENGYSKFIVYFSTCAAVDYFYRILRRLPELSHFHFSSLHGHLPPPIRTSTLSTFTTHSSTPLRPSVLLCTDVAARGLDLPDVDVVVQYDAPMDPKVFSHRAGRAARMGRQGKGIVLLTKGSEEGYIEFLALRKIPLRKQAYIGPTEDQAENDGGESSTAGEKASYAVDPAADALQLAIQNIVLEDRDLADKAAKAFVSAVRAYSKHEASYIFRLRDLDVFGMGKSFGLLRLPRMPEIRDWKERVAKARERQEKGKAGEDDERLVSSSWQDRDMNWDEFAYVSKTREAQRLAELKEAESKKDEIAAEREQAAKVRREMAEKRVAWSVKKDRKDRKDVRREKKDRKKDWEAKEAKRSEAEAAAGPTSDKPTAQGSAAVTSDGDGDDDMDEYRDVKKSKKEHSGGNMIQSDMFDDLS
ncbi:hypothetical protein QFC24_001030 [Naganishia onofrii]|uniref:Uncharacterized protein n=1 Tax=Naganishia onofrii TaxID=1851511 RepID=A0ACC2XW86_9TREE|nr:hypothetical protein QFC24_001030 [Naganishia onofrii]